jgi:hypothetical protein
MHQKRNGVNFVMAPNLLLDVENIFWTSDGAAPYKRQFSLKPARLPTPSHNKTQSPINWEEASHVGLSFLNLCFALLLTTLFTMQHSAWVTGPGSRYILVNYDGKQSRSHSVLEPAWKDSPPGDAPRISIGFFSELWRRSIMMREWMLECETTYWETLRAASGAEADLVEARFHLANAEVFAAAFGEPQKATIELERTERYLVSAQPSVEKNALPVLATIKEAIGATRRDLNLNPAPK